MLFKSLPDTFQTRGLPAAAPSASRKFCPEISVITSPLGFLVITELTHCVKLDELALSLVNSDEKLMGLASQIGLLEALTGPPAKLLAEVLIWIQALGLG